MKKFYTRTVFWKKVEQTLGIGGAISVASLGWNDAPGWVFLAIGVCGFFGKALLIWIEDKDNNGTVDWFEENSAE